MLFEGAELTFIQDINPTSTPPDERRSLLLFDLSSIPVEATITSAELQFYVDTEGQGFNMYRMLKPWDEATITYTSNGGHFAANGTDAESAFNANWPGDDGYVGFITVTVPAATIQEWIDGTLTNYGWLMIATHADDGQQLASREYATQADRPKLTVDYTLPPVNVAPTDISLSNTSVAENEIIGTVVGTLSSSDPDAGNTFTYSLVTGAGDADNASFDISGDQLITKEVFNFEVQLSYSIRLRTTDQGGLSFEKAFTIMVTDANDTPVASDQEVTTEADTPVGITLMAIDEDGDDLTWFTGDPSHGSLTGSGPNLTYTPDSGYFGPDSFTFFVSDDGGTNLSNTSTVTINVLEPVLFTIYLPLIIK